MKRLTYTILILIIAPALVNAQTGTSPTFSLDECIKYALENTVGIKNARVDEHHAGLHARASSPSVLQRVAKR